MKINIKPLKESSYRFLSKNLSRNTNLGTQSQIIDKITSSSKKIEKKMLEGCMGLGLPYITPFQVNDNRKMIIFSNKKVLSYYNNVHNPRKLVTMLNPKYSVPPEVKSVEVEETCSKYPNLWYRTHRYPKITANFKRRDGKEATREYTGQNAFIYQAACDDLDTNDRLGPLINKGTLFLRDEIKELSYFKRIVPLLDQYNEYGLRFLELFEGLNEYSSENDISRNLELEEYTDTSFSGGNRNENQSVIDPDDYKNPQLAYFLSKNPRMESEYRDLLVQGRNLRYKIRLNFQFVDEHVILDQQEGNIEGKGLGIEENPLIFQNY